MSSWNSFIIAVQEIISSMEVEGCDIPFFRGQNSSDWPLLPSLLRKNKRKVIETVLYYDFISYSSPLFNEYKQSPDSWDILFEMQHCGIPTRLLDWTENFAVALYFALKGNPTKPCIWILNPFELNKLSTDEETILNPKLDLDFSYFGGFIESKERTLQNPISIIPSRQSKRVFAQKGVFTMQMTKSEPLEKLFPDCLHKLEIPLASINDAKQFLFLAGVNEYSLFPDFDGLAKYLIDRHF